MRPEIIRHKIGGLQIVEAQMNQHNKDILNKFIITCGSTASKVTQEKIRRNMVKVYDIIEVDYDKITLDILRQFLNLVKDSDLMPPTKNELRKVLKRFLKEQYSDWSSRFKELADIKGENEINVNKINADTIFTKNEMEQLIRGCDSLKYKALFMLMYETAGRPEEIEKLRWKDVKLDKGEVTLRSSKKGTLRIVPFQKATIHLKRYKQEYPYLNVAIDDYVFPGRKDRDKHITNIAVDIYFKNVGKKVLERNVWPYLIRHTRATELQKVLPAKVYEKFMDHSIETATRYSHLNKDDVRDAMFKNVYEVEEISEEEENQIKREIEHLKKQNKNMDKKWEAKFNEFSSGLKRELMDMEKERAEIWENKKVVGNKIILEKKI